MPTLSDLTRTKIGNGFIISFFIMITVTLFSCSSPRDNSSTDNSNSGSQSLNNKQSNYGASHAESASPIDDNNDDSKNESNPSEQDQPTSKGDLYIFCKINGDAIRSAHGAQFGLIGQLAAAQRTHGESSQEFSSLLSKYNEATRQLENLLPTNVRQGKSLEEAAMEFADCNNFRS
jgi:hypothetical protein